MELEHIALVINDPNEVERFYGDLLGMHKVKELQLNRDLSARVFGRDRETTVFQMQRNGLFVELFIAPEKHENSFRHICFSVNEREDFLEMAIQKGYEYIRISRTRSDLVFLKDGSGNMFEIIEKTPKTT